MPVTYVALKNANGPNTGRLHKELLVLYKNAGTVQRCHRLLWNILNLFLFILFI